MKTNELYKLMKNPSLLTQETLPELKKLVDSYPCFSVARMLYLKNLSLSDENRFNTELNKMAVHIPDRKKLFFLIEGTRYGLEEAITVPKRKDETNDSFSLIDAFLSDYTEKQPDNMEALLSHPSVSSDYLYWIQKEDPKENKEETRLQHQELIDSFIQSEEETSGNRRHTETKKEENAPDISEKTLDDSCFTETLAQIYIKQQRYEKALQIIKNLSLKYPEKNIYFADQISFLEKLIINTKK